MTVAKLTSLETHILGRESPGKDNLMTKQADESRTECRELNTAENLVVARFVDPAVDELVQSLSFQSRENYPLDKESLEGKKKNKNWRDDDY